MARKRADSLEELVAKGMAEFGQIDERVPYTPPSSDQSDDQAIEQPTSSPATQEVRELIKPVQAVETRTSWIIPGQTAEPANVMDTNSDPPVEPSDDDSEAPTEPEPELEPAKEAPTPPRVVKPSFSDDLEIEW